MSQKDKDKTVHIDIDGADGADTASSNPEETEDAIEPEAIEPEAIEPEAIEADEVSLDEMSEEELIEAAKQAGVAAAEEEIANQSEANLLDMEARAVTAETKLEEAQVALAEAQERALRIQADWENFRKRTAQERLDERARATEKLVTNLLPVIDDLERALEHTKASASDEITSQLAAGVEAVMNKIVDILSHDGVEQISPKGEAFDPLEHQAVGREEDTSVYDETVAQVYQKGYRMGGKVIRPAMVTVAFGGPKRPVSESEAEQEQATTPPEADQEN